MLFRSIALSLILSFSLSLFCDVKAEHGILTRPNSVDEPTHVEFGLYLIDVDSIDAADQGFNANFVVVMRWKDERLKDPTRRRRKMSVEDVWTPDLLITNMQNARTDLPEIVEVHSDGTVHYRQRYYGHFSEPMQLQKFPFDKHTLRLHFVLPGYQEDKVIFHNDHFKNVTGISKQITTAEWDIEGWRAYPKAYEVKEFLPSISGFIFELDVSRRYGYYLLKVLLPLSLIVFMSWMVFWINPTRLEAQIALSSTSMLTLIAYRFILEVLIPRVSYLTLMDSFLLGATLLVFAALLEVTVVSYLVYKDHLEIARKLDKISRRLFPAAFLILVSVLGYQAFFLLGT